MSSAVLSPRHAVLGMIALTCFGGALFTPRTGFTQAAITVETERCPGLDQAELGRLLSLEIDMAGLPVDGVAVVQVMIRCANDQTVIQVADSVTEKQLQRTLTGSSSDNRVVALAAAELITASWLELLLQGSTDLPIEPRDQGIESVTDGPPTPGDRRFAREHARNSLEEDRSWPVLRAAIEFGIRAGASQTSRGHGGLLFGLSPRDGVGLRFGLFTRMEFGEARRAIGTIDILTVQAGLGLGISIPLAEWVRFAFDLRGSLGYGSLVAAAPSQEVSAASVAGLTSDLSLTWSPEFQLGRFLIAPSLEIGAGLAGPRGTVSGEESVETTGLFFGGGLAFGVLSR